MDLLKAYKLYYNLFILEGDFYEYSIICVTNFNLVTDYFVWVNSGFPHDWWSQKRFIKIF